LRGLDLSDRCRAGLEGQGVSRKLAKVVDSLGGPLFYDNLLDYVSDAVTNDLAALVRYARSGPPDMILPRIAPTPAMQSYTQEFHVHDPFHLHWTTTGATGVFRLRGLDPGIAGSRYAREFLSEMRIHDEIAIFLPPLGEAAPTLILDRADAPFTRAEVARIKALYPLLASLHRRHLGLVIMTGEDLALAPAQETRALRIVDQSGREIYATGAWKRAYEEEEGALAATLAELGDTGPCLAALGDGRAVRRTRLRPDFGAAPGGFCDELTGDPAGLPRASADRLPATLAALLSPREQDVVRLTLQGYPVIEIARRLGLSRGTVKNHRLAIYRKLDITTERELFGEYMRAFAAGADG
jgi:DNA-binding CsgD family transcriptional regulator